MTWAFKYAQHKALQYEREYRYEAKNGNCRAGKGHVQLSGHTVVKKNSDSALAHALNKGPVSVAVATGAPFRFYRSGVVKGRACGTRLTHGVLAVGYTNDHILVKNSWGTGWGAQGYIKIGRENGAGVCGINQVNSFPHV